MTKVRDLDARQASPKSIKATYKFYQKLDSDALNTNSGVIDFGRGLSAEQKKQCKEVQHMPQTTVKAACLRFGRQSQLDCWPFVDIPIFEHKAVKGEAINQLTI